LFWPKSQTEEIIAQIQSCSALWSHPMLLPNILLYHHLVRAERFSFLKLSEKVVDIQSELGVNRAGRLSATNRPVEDVVGKGTINQTKLNMRVLTSEMSTLITDIIWFVHVSQWQCDCTEFLSKVMNDLPKVLPQRSVGMSAEIQESIEYMASAAKILSSYNNGLRNVMESELSVVNLTSGIYTVVRGHQLICFKLYSVIAQIDNRLNAKMTASSSRDSTAMKTLAFITTLFLPGTFVAVSFSQELALSLL
jgi:hypothetical protein